MARRTTSTAAAMVILGATGLAGAFPIAAGAERPPVGGPAVRVLVRFSQRADAARIGTVEQAAGASEVSINADLGVRLLRLPLAALDELETNPLVDFAEPDALALPTDTVPNDPYFPSGSGAVLGGQWGLARTQGPTAWGTTTGSRAVVIAVVDSGIAPHPDLVGQLVAGYNVLDGTTNTGDTLGHGTNVAGVIAAATNNATGVAGMCWQCSIMPVKVYNDATGGTYGNLATGITWAVDHGARVVNVSMAGTARSSTLDSAIAYATQRNVPVVVAAGNGGCDCPTYPASSPGAISVGASDQTDTLFNYSNFGSWVTVNAPGQNLTTTLTDPFTGAQWGYAPIGGTSLAAPIVSGLTGLMATIDPYATPTDLANLLGSTADPVVGSRQAAHGRVNAARAVAAALASPTPAPTGGSTGSTAGTTTQTLSFSGSFSSKQSTRSYSITTGSGTATAKLVPSKCASITLSLQASGATVSGPVSTSTATLNLSSAVSAGSYSYVVSGSSRCSFTLTVTVPG